MCGIFPHFFVELWNFSTLKILALSKKTPQRSEKNDLARLLLEVWCQALQGCNLDGRSKGVFEVFVCVCELLSKALELIRVLFFYHRSNHNIIYYEHTFEIFRRIYLRTTQGETKAQFYDKLG